MSMDDFYSMLLYKPFKSQKARQIERVFFGQKKVVNILIDRTFKVSFFACSTKRRIGVLSCKTICKGYRNTLCAPGI